MIAPALLLALALAAPTGPVKWVGLAQDRDGELFYDPASLKRTGGRVRLTTRVVAKRGPGDSPFSLIIEQEIDCVRQTSATFSIRQFGAGPEPVRTRILPPDRIERDTIFAGSNLAGLYRAVCPRGPVLKSPPAQPLVQVVPPPSPRAD